MWHFIGIIHISPNHWDKCGYCLSGALNLSASCVFSFHWSCKPWGQCRLQLCIFKNYFLLLRVRNRWRRRPCQPWLAPLSSPDVEGAACKPHRDVFIWLPRYTTLPDACWRRRREKSQCFVFSSPTRPDHALPERSLAANFDWRSSGFRKSTA